MPKSTAILFLSLLLSLLVAGCSFGFPGVYRIDIPQGNLLDERKVEQLQIGMEPRQVRYLLGTPLINDTFNPDRWDYYYSLIHENKTTVDHHLIITFKDGRVENIEDRLKP